MFLSFALKIAFSNFFSLKQKFLSIRGLAISSFALNTELVFSEALKNDLLQLSSKMTFLQKSLNK